MPLWTILTKWPLPAGPVCIRPPSGASDFRAGPMAAYASGAPPTIRQYPFFNPQIPPLVPASQKWMPRSASSLARRCESRKLELPPSTMMSPFCMRAASEVTNSSVIFPAGTIVQQTRGGASAAITSSRVVAGAAPTAASSAARRGSTS